jgi:hypothetical protein
MADQKVAKDKRKEDKKSKKDGQPKEGELGDTKQPASEASIVKSGELLLLLLSL